MKSISSLRFIPVLFLFLVPVSAFCCLNEEEQTVRTRSDGSMVSTYIPHSYRFSHGFDEAYLKNEKEELEKELKLHPTSYELKTSYGIVLVKLGEAQKALKIFQELIARYPHEYSANANLGTAYELTGNNKLALEHIQKAVRINPGSHEESEWIHIELLKAKIKAETEPSYLSTHSILNLNLDIHKTYSEKDLEHFRQIKRQLEWQLKERISLVDAPDPVVANLLYDLANLVAVTEFLETSLAVYDEALRYSNNDKKIQNRKDKVNSIIFEAKLKKYSVTGLVALLVLAGIYFIVRWAIFGNKKKEAKVVYN